MFLFYEFIYLCILTLEKEKKRRRRMERGSATCAREKGGSLLFPREKLRVLGEQGKERVDC